MSHDSVYYRSQAARARGEADAATLDNVRDRALRSVAAFEAMAESIERVARLRVEREANTAAAVAEARASAMLASEAAVA